MNANKKIYLDYAASTPIDPKVLKKIRKAEKIFGNPSSIHSFGLEARNIIDDARQTAADFLGVKSYEIIFTSGATEANNLAIKGILNTNFKPHVITTQIEHESVLKTIEILEKNGEIEVTYLKPNQNGIIKAEDVKNAIKPNTVLVSVIFTSNILGVTQDIKKIGEVIKNWRKGKKSGYPYFHTDAAQAFQWLDGKVGELGVDLVTFSGHKIFAPKGVGGLFIKESVILRPILNGGGQEYGYRAGTENIIGIAALGEAIRLLKPGYKKQVLALRDFLIKEFKKIKGAKLNGEKENLAPHILNVRLPVSGEDLLITLDRARVAVSYGSACGSRAAKPSSALLAIGLSEAEAKSSLRISIGRTTTKEEIKRFVKILKDILKKFKK